MNARVEQKPALRAAGLRHIGPYDRINEAFGRLGEIAGRGGLFAHPGAMMIAIYHDDPDSTPANALRSDAAVVVPEGVAIPDALTEQRISAGRYATTIHTGPYDRLPGTWARLRHEWIPAHNVRPRDGESYEVYLNNPMTTKPEALETEICVPVTESA